jgi:spore germination cell wall hydrolase CwlJ-like protein
MKNKYVYIITALAVVMLLICIVQVLVNLSWVEHQVALQQIAALTAENAALQQNIADMESTIDKLLQNMQQLTKENEQLKAQQTRQSEAQKTSRSADRPRYNLTDAERDLVERVVMAESGGESYKGQMLVAQCILNACEIDGIRPAEVIRKYVYAKARPEPSDSVKRAVSAVFDKGEQVTDEPIVYFYAPALVRSEFHESQRFALTEGNHKFFCAR